MSNPYFSNAWYLQYNPDVQAAGMDPQAHYGQYGAREAYLQDAATRRPAPWFDLKYYLLTNPDVALATGNNLAWAFTHFTQYGIAEGRAPSAAVQLNAFNLSAYAQANPDLIEAFAISNPDSLTSAQQNALASHYYQYGWHENRPADPAGNYEYMLTSAANHLVMSMPGSSVTAPLALDAGGLHQTLNASDVIEGGPGEQALYAQLNGVDRLGTEFNPSITGVENYHLSALSTHDNAPAVLDLGRASGYKLVNSVASEAPLEVTGLSAPDNQAPVLGVQGLGRGSSAAFQYAGQVAGITEQVIVMHELMPHYDGLFDITVDGLADGFQIHRVNAQTMGDVFVNLAGAASQVRELEVSGSGAALIESDGAFARLLSIDSRGHDGFVAVGAEQAFNLHTVQNGAGSSGFAINHRAFNGLLSVDLGAGEDSIVIAGLSSGDNHGQISGLDFTGGFQNVNSLGFNSTVVLGADAVLDLAGFDTQLNELVFHRRYGDLDTDFAFAGNGHLLDIRNVPVSTLNVQFSDDAAGLNLQIDGVQSLHINALNESLTLDSLAAPELETLVIYQISLATAAMDISLQNNEGELGQLRSLALEIDWATDQSSTLTLASGSEPEGAFTFLETLDFSRLANGFDISVADARFGDADAPNVLTYRMAGGSGQFTAQDAGAMDGGGSREVFSFDAATGIGSEVVIHNFWMGDTLKEANRDVIDLSSFGYAPEDLDFQVPLTGVFADPVAGMRNLVITYNDEWAIVLTGVLSSEHTPEDFAYYNLLL